MTRKKIVLVIVEGVSDDTALGVALDQVYNKDFVHIEILHGDITTKKGVFSQNIISALGKVVVQYARSHHYKSSDFKQIIHLVDLDGAYIPDDNIYQDESADRFRYEEDGIYAKDVERVIQRNEQKRENLLRLRSTGMIWKIPYRVYYMSSNLDHVLHNKPNSTDEEKEDDAYEFAKRFRGDPDGFVRYMCDSSFAVNMDFRDSWKYIESGLNSVNRHTNFGICIREEYECRGKNE